MMYYGDPNYYGQMGYGQMAALSDSGMGLGGVILIFILLIVLAFVVIRLVILFTHNSALPRKNLPTGIKEKNIVNDFTNSFDRAIDILKERYARGEIDKFEFEEKKKDILFS